MIFLSMNFVLSAWLRVYTKTITLLKSIGVLIKTWTLQNRMSESNLLLSFRTKWLSYSNSNLYLKHLENRKMIDLARMLSFWINWKGDYTKTLNIFRKIWFVSSYVMYFNIRNFLFSVVPAPKKQCTPTKQVFIQCPLRENLKWARIWIALSVLFPWRWSSSHFVCFLSIFQTDEHWHK